MLLLGIYLASELLQARVPKAVLDRARACTRVRNIAARVVNGLLGEQHMSRPLANYGLFPAIMERRTDRMRYYYDVVIAPTPWEWQWIALPALMRPAYFALRPLRLISRAIGRGMKQADAQS